MASGRRKKSKEEPAVKQEDKKEDKPVKRRRSADGDRQFRDDKRQRTSPENDRRIRQKIERPGVPAPTRTSAFVVPDRPSPPFREDDKDGHFVYELGDNLTSRYKILSKMGEGTFGRVLECWDRKNKEYVAIKIVRNVQKYRDAAMIELEVLNTLEKNDAEGRWHCVNLLEWFDYRGHVCMAFEKLGLSLYDFLRRNGYTPFHVNLVRSFGKQLLESVAYLHDLQLIHTDLKPENILLASLEYSKHSEMPTTRGAKRMPDNSDIKVIDFGSATFDDQYHSSIVSTRHYRAPEVILGLGWTFPCDIWSVGCILVELATGDALFQTHENLEHLAMMEAVLDKIPEHLAAAANAAARKYFVTRRDKLVLNWPGGAASRRSVRAVAKLSPLKTLMSSLGDKSLRPHLDALLDLLMQMLRYDPKERITAHEALRHDFFRMGAAATPTSNGRVRPEKKETSATAEPAEAAVLGLGGSGSGKGSSQVTEGASKPGTTKVEEPVPPEDAE
ncbi:Serine/threonine-protein kinase AFC2 [Coccomyxa sp. Obi]|nr:Serine/threonine-protein kinase AFC2 [Coccomyxa sp. Obi]